MMKSDAKELKALERIWWKAQWEQVTKHQIPVRHYQRETRETERRKQRIRNIRIESFENDILTGFGLLP